jgi:hypothetical protein
MKNSSRTSLSGWLGAYTTPETFNGDISKWPEVKIFLTYI